MDGGHARSRSAHVDARVPYVNRSADRSHVCAACTTATDAWCDLRRNARAHTLITGGNRLGMLLLELRKEFRLRGVQCATLPQLLTETPDSILGSDAAAENIDIYGELFDPADEKHTTQIWASECCIQVVVALAQTH
jgi:hypothetical protein